MAASIQAGKRGHELMSTAKERPTAYHNAQWHSQKYLDRQYLIRKMVVLCNV